MLKGIVHFEIIFDMF